MDLPDELRPWITRVGVLRLDTVPKEPFVHLPDPDTKVVVRVEGDGRRSVLVVGPRVRATYHAGKPIVSCVEVRLAPGTTLPLLGVPAVDPSAGRCSWAISRARDRANWPPNYSGWTPTPSRRRTGSPRSSPPASPPWPTPPAPNSYGPASTRCPSAPAASPARYRTWPVNSPSASGSCGTCSPRASVSPQALRPHQPRPCRAGPRHGTVLGPTRRRHRLLRPVPHDLRLPRPDGVPPRSYFTGRLPEAMPCRVIRRG